MLKLSGGSIDIEDYADAAHTIRRWFAEMGQDARRP
jgi:hypothetical protein